MAQEFERFVLAAGDTHQRAHRSHDVAWLSLVKADHVIYKQRAYRAVEAGDAECAKLVGVDHKNCRLGKWYASDAARKHFGQHPAYAALETPHVGVHTAAHRAIALSQDGSWETDTNKQVEILAALRAMEEASNGVMEQLENLASSASG
ncbi:MAG: CZB domain-containing protein [Methylophilaceae bacterium]|nr:CZB domain-containing protein [Methylophilaceae bacterium]